MGCNTSQEKTAVPTENGDVVVSGDNEQNVETELINKLKSDVKATALSASNGISDSATINGDDPMGIEEGIYQNINVS